MSDESDRAGDIWSFLHGKSMTCTSFHAMVRTPILTLT